MSPQRRSIESCATVDSRSPDNSIEVGLESVVQLGELYSHFLFAILGHRTNLEGNVSYYNNQDGSYLPMMKLKNFCDLYGANSETQ